MDLACKQIGSGPPVVVLHGLFGMSDNWLSIARELKEHYTFYLPDLRNHGRSPHDKLINYDVMAKDVTVFLDKYNLKKITLIGHSLGGKVAMNLAALYPAYLRKLVVVDITNKIYRSSYFEEYIDVMLSLDLTKLHSRREAEEAFLNKKEVPFNILQFLLKNLYRNNDNQFKWRLNLTALKENMGNVLSAVNISSPVLTDTLFMKGSESNYILEQDYKDIKKDFPNANVVVIDGANHWVHAAAPQNFIKAFLNFQES